MKPKTMETLAWVLLYGGGLIAILGLAILASNDGLATALFVVAGIALVSGVFLIWLRSRSPD